ncbi:MAG TPA: hypothetical protein VKA36_10975 [Solirubrobacterales bacterium]|nr:hypothetical protein [Solirubrobacterales bacterium]
MDEHDRDYESPEVEEAVGDADPDPAVTAAADTITVDGDTQQ